MKKYKLRYLPLFAKCNLRLRKRKYKLVDFGDDM